MPSQVAVWEDEDDKFFTCPLRFITDEASSWFECYKYNLKFPGTAERFPVQSAKYIEAMYYFERKFRQFQTRYKAEDEVNKRTTDALNTLRATFNKKR